MTLKSTLTASEYIHMQVNLHICI